MAVGLEAVGLIATPLALLILPLRWDPGAMALTFFGGMVGGFGLILFYRAMALDLIGVVAPITAVLAAALPTVVGVAIGGERLHLGQGAGIVAGLLAIVLINGGGRASRKSARQGVTLAVVAGVTFGLFFVIYHYASPGGVAAFVSGRFGSGVMAVSYALLTKVPVLPRPDTWRLVGIAGTLDGVGLVLFLFATLYGLLSISALLTSFYPAFTILCARFFLHERLSAMQASGAVVAVIAVAAIAAA